MGTYKSVEKCAEPWCRTPSVPEDVWCADHWQDKLGTRQKPVLTYVQNCWVCSRESFHQMTRDDHRALVARYALKCPGCHNMSVSLSLVDHVVAA